MHSCRIPYNIWKLTVFRSVLNPKHCRLVLFFFVSNSTLYRVNGVLFQLRYVTIITRCVNLTRCLICPHPMLSKANRLLPCLLTLSCIFTFQTLSCRNCSYVSQFLLLEFSLKNSWHRSLNTKYIFHNVLHTFSVVLIEGAFLTKDAFDWEIWIWILKYSNGLE